MPMTDADTDAAPFGGAARMAGNTSADVGSTSPASGSPGVTGQQDAQRQLSSVVQVIRQSEESLMGIAGSFPQAAKEIRDARAAIRAVLTKIVSEPGGQAPASPNTAY